MAYILETNTALNGLLNLIKKNEPISVKLLTKILPQF